MCEFKINSDYDTSPCYILWQLKYPQGCNTSGKPTREVVRIVGEQFIMNNILIKFNNNYATLTNTNIKNAPPTQTPTQTPTPTNQQIRNRNNYTMKMSKS